jgi:hypothetical protein
MLLNTMNFTPEEITEFQGLYLARFGVALDTTEAADRFSELVALVKLIERLD